ncbi:hypothetical protein MNEG_9077 [Monoraphidium neglectum]|uniref:Uncharacterized protein n=1 Tax=Monoraphidium neglectum TaxID=145388 RepID=A0A0D2KTV6_9CHLO|nr:hypothetical protein MNEG_9077 [Monoraphidium neglectum]KIY98888.1 hypothetical protein MNEG_9077 [Monoraphidium neglectum]|eukprot:XP_013897908.1 hypothetical protein MNEG_9077 [Monoraphidium neglectum]
MGGTAGPFKDGVNCRPTHRAPLRLLTARIARPPLQVGGEAGLQRLAAQAAALQRSVAEATARLAAAERARQADRAFLQVRQAQQMAALSAKKRGEMEARVARLSRSREALLAALGHHQGGGGAGAGGGGCGGGAVSDGEWQAKYEAIKGKLGRFKAMKKELAALEAEVAVAGRTRAVLEAQAGGPPADANQHHGPSALRGSRDGPLSATPAATATAAAAAAGQGVPGDLDSLRAAIASKKAELAPKVQQLRTARERFQDVEARLSAAREARDAAVGPLEARCADLDSEVASLQKEVDAAQAAAAAADSALVALQDGLARVAAEPGGAEALRERAERQASQAEAELRRLREQQRAIAAAAAGGLAQRAALRGAAAVLEAKIRAAAAGGAGGAAAAPPPLARSYSTATANVAVF